SMVACFLLAVGVAVGHYFYCLYLHERPVSETIPQSWNNGATLAFARTFSIILAASASPAFTQVLWWYLRRRPMPLLNIDALFSLNSSPFYLYQLTLLKLVPFMWFFGLLFPLISIVTIFPPGSLVVQPSLIDTILPKENVPGFDLGFRGNKTAQELFDYVIFEVTDYGAYQGSKANYSRNGIISLLSNTYITGFSPCGQNCSYNLTFIAPSMSCKYADFSKQEYSRMQSNFPDLHLISEGDSHEDPDSGFILNPEIDFLASADASGDYFLFNLVYRNPNGTNMSSISCMTNIAKYTAQVEYIDSIQNLTIMNTTILMPLNARGHDEPVFQDIMKSEYPDKLIDNGDTRADFYRQCQLRSIQDALVDALKGWITSTSEGGYSRNNTLIQHTKFAVPFEFDTSQGYDNLTGYHLTPEIVEELMKNVSISIFNAGRASTPTFVKKTPWEPCYVFDDRKRLLIAYAGALGVCFVFLLFGFGAMFQNGVSAVPGGFLQILCTTTDGDGTLNQISKKAYLGGYEAVPRELKELKIRFG
ncbi:hypothetical protein BS50DRAFT_444163, partial [Corynespora cassiicola Philippines]